MSETAKPTPDHLQALSKRIHALGQQSPKQHDALLASSAYNHQFETFVHRAISPDPLPPENRTIEIRELLAVLSDFPDLQRVVFLTATTEEEQTIGIETRDKILETMRTSIRRIK